MSDKSGVALSTTQAIEVGRYEPSVLIAHQVAAALHVRALEMWPKLYDKLYPLLDVLKRGGSIE